MLDENDFNIEIEDLNEIFDFEVDFDLDDNKKEDYSLKKNRYIKPKFHNTSTIKVKYENAKKMAKETYQDIFDNNRIYAIVGGNFIAGDFIEALMVESNQYAKEKSKLIISGSANLRSSRNLEQISIEHNTELYDFNYTWHNAILDKYKTINKSILEKDAYDLVSML